MPERIVGESKTGGELVVAQLLEEGVERVFCVPGESYLAVIDAMYDVSAQMELITARHESGAAMMAAASGQLTGRPGVAFVTRGPGATNASIAVHIARQGSMPLVLGVGQVKSGNIGRESFQEVDYLNYFGAIAKHVRQMESTADIPQAISDAFEIACSDRMGPVVLAFPEDVLRRSADARSLPPRELKTTNVEQAIVDGFATALRRASKPIIIVGGGYWSDTARSLLHGFAELHAIPVCAAFRRQDIFDNEHPCYAGVLGFNTPDALWERIEEADCVLVLGARLDEPTTRDYRIFRSGRNARMLLHVHPEESQLGLNYQPDLAICASPNDVMPGLSETLGDPVSSAPGWCAELRAQFLAGEKPPATPEGHLLGEVMASLNGLLPSDAIVTTDAGNFSAWPQRYRRYSRPGRLLAPINGAMGWGVPSGVAASLIYPERVVVSCVGDGGMLMTGMELATALAHDAKPIILVFNNQTYGTIRSHQRKQYPGREIGTGLHNPDFAAFARSFGAFGTRVVSGSEFHDAFTQARDSNKVALIELCMPID